MTNRILMETILLRKYLRNTGCLKLTNITRKLTLQDGVQPEFVRRGRRGKLHIHSDHAWKKRLNVRLQQEGVSSINKFTPIVPLPKANGTMRTCVDY